MHSLLLLAYLIFPKLFELAMTFGRSLPGHAFSAAVLVVPIVQANHIRLLLVNFCKFPLFLISVKLPFALFSLKGICDHPLNHR